MAVLAVNAGSSSLKFSLFRVENHEIGACVLSGAFQGLEPHGAPRFAYTVDGETVSGSLEHAQEQPFQAALMYLQQLLTARGDVLRAIGHRVVHGGTQYRRSVAVTPQVIADLLALHPLAPLHEKHNVAGIQIFQAAFPDVPQAACFDTAFHAGHHEREYTFALPLSYREQGIRRYGFHGLSYQFIRDTLFAVSARAAQKTVMLHLGNGSSACAMRDGRSIASSMGFTALEGLMMGSRCGALDAGVVLHLMSAGMDHAALEKLLYRQSGLLGVSGLSADMRVLRASDEAAARLAIDLYTYRVVREIGGLSAVLGGLDVLTFSAGIGENDAVLRAEVCAALAYLGVKIDAAQNHAADGKSAVAIHAADSRQEVWVIPTDEGKVAAQQALQVAQELAGEQIA
ncbi:MAG: acetate/propionate family kinase [Neisseria sp.]|nr:acetate/propionate family kinase [Neisseria sp.]